jgi:hypothetical protein
MNFKKFSFFCSHVPAWEHNTQAWKHNQTLTQWE